MIENFLSNVNNFWLTEPRYRSKVMGPYFALTLKNDLQKYNILDKQTCFLWVKMLSVYSFSTWWTKYVEFGLTHKNYNDLAKAHPQGFVIVLQVARHTKLLQNFNFLTFHNRELLITLIQNDWFLPVNSWKSNLFAGRSWRSHLKKLTIKGSWFMSRLTRIYSKPICS